MSPQDTSAQVVTLAGATTAAGTKALVEELIPSWP
jgi:hypothetical protein